MRGVHAVQVYGRRDGVGWIENETNCDARRGRLKILRVKLNPPNPYPALPHCHP